MSLDTGDRNQRFTFRDREVVLAWPYATEAEGRTYDVSPDGQRFLAIKTTEQAGEVITIVMNWVEELKRRVSTPQATRLYTRAARQD